MKNLQNWSAFNESIEPEDDKKFKLIWKETPAVELNKIVRGAKLYHTKEDGKFVDWDELSPKTKEKFINYMKKS